MNPLRVLVTGARLKAEGRAFPKKEFARACVGGWGGSGTQALWHPGPCGRGKKPREEKGGGLTSPP